jgi:hypothetical protein
VLTGYFSYDGLLQEKEELEVAFERLQLDVKHSQTGNAVKEIRVLKKIINDLEVHNFISHCLWMS